MAALLSSDDLLRIGLSHIKLSPEVQAQRSFDANWNDFVSHFGAPPSTLSVQWYDLCTTDIPDAKLSNKEKGEKGVRHFLMAHHFLWAYPKNSSILGKQFGVCSKLASGESLWSWVRRLAALRAARIIWPEALFNDPNSEIYIITVDGTDCKTWERKHPTLPIDKGFFSKKHNHAGLKYELGVSIFHDKIVWAAGSFKPSRHDITCWRYGDGTVDEDGHAKALKTMIPKGKLCIGNLGYRTMKNDKLRKIAFPNSKDALEVKKFKSLARCRHEGVNGCIKKYASMFNEFTHGREKHEYAFFAIVVTIQYKLDVGDAFLYKV